MKTTTYREETGTKAKNSGASSMNWGYMTGQSALKRFRPITRKHGDNKDKIKGFQPPQGGIQIQIL